MRITKGGIGSGEKGGENAEEGGKEGEKEEGVMNEAGGCAEPGADRWRLQVLQQKIDNRVRANKKEQRCD